MHEDIYKLILSSAKCTAVGPCADYEIAELQKLFDRLLPEVYQDYLKKFG